MHDRTGTTTSDEDLNEGAFRVVREATMGQDEMDELDAEESGKNPAAVALGRLGGLKGGPARARKLSKARRQEIARKAAQARWGKTGD